jgi:hypothetical protein
MWPHRTELIARASEAGGVNITVLDSMRCVPRDVVT